MWYRCNKTYCVFIIFFIREVIALHRTIFDLRPLCWTLWHFEQPQRNKWSLWPLSGQPEKINVSTTVCSTAPKNLSAKKRNTFDHLNLGCMFPLSIIAFHFQCIASTGGGLDKRGSTSDTSNQSFVKCGCCNAYIVEPRSWAFLSFIRFSILFSTVLKQLSFSVGQNWKLDHLINEI